MCGIAGYIGPERIAPDRLAACQAVMRRRGPDGEGAVHVQTRSGGHVHLLHSRLAILDLDKRSDQPFRHGDGILCYNGEIYNYLELAASLKAKNCTFATAGDTEILACLLDQQGLQAVESCEGMWAFAWFDQRTDKLFLCRDRFGEKPLYIARKESQKGVGIFFGSEVKFLFALMGQTRPINQRQLRRYLINGYKSLYKSRETFFDGVWAVDPGMIATVQADGRYDETRFWSPQFDREDDSLSYKASVAGARDRLIRSVELRLRADVPVAFCLSGGIDSNALIAIAKRHLGYNVHGFTIMNTDSRYEERDMVETAVQDLKLQHTPINVDITDFLPGLEKLIHQHDAPIYTITYYAQWRLMEAIAAEGYKVSVSGTAADELFSGYFDHHNAYLAALYKQDKDAYQTALSHWQTEIAPLIRNPYLQNPDYFLDHPLARDHIYLDADKFADLMVTPFFEPFSEIFYTESLLRNRMANELLHETVPVILHEDDLNAMYYSIENRSPFLDTDLFEWCTNIPTRHLVQKGRAKAVLRDAVRGLAPDIILDNPRKVGFNAPLLDYLEIGDPSVKKALLSDSPIFDIVRRDLIEILFDKRNLANSESKFLFNFINAKIFIEEYGE